MRSKKAIYNIIASLIQQFIVLACGFIVPKLIINNFGSNVNGLVSSITEFLTYITLLEAGIGPVIKVALYKPIANKNKKEIENILKASEKFFRTIAIIFIVYLIVLVLVYPTTVENEFSPVYTRSLIIIISISIFAEYYFGMTYKLYLQAEQKTYITAIIQTLTYITNTIAIIIMIKFSNNIHLVKLIGCLTFIFRPIAQNIYVKHKYKIKLKNADGEYKLEQKWDGLAQHIASVIHGNTDIAVLTIFASIADVSVYYVYALVVKGIKSIIQAFTGGIDSFFGDIIAKKEDEYLRKTFSTYELIYLIIATIIYSSATILIVPFISVYTKGIEDANYIRTVFAFLLVFGEFIWAVRQPYNQLIKAAGKFKETRIGAWIEVAINIIISVALVLKYGLVGVAIGTLIAMAYRTAEYIYYSTKHIVKRKKIFGTFSKVTLFIIDVFLICFINANLPYMQTNTYLEWILYSIRTLILSTIVVISISCIFYKNDAKRIIGFLKQLCKKKLSKR